jgi:small nuclear ribonucleoprotein (snRNP)-like protein
MDNTAANNNEEQQQQQQDLGGRHGRPAVAAAAVAPPAVTAGSRRARPTQQQQQQQQQRRPHGPPKRRPPKVIRTLPSMLRYMEGLEVVVELKTGKRHRGIMVSAEDDMNITLQVQQLQQQEQVTTMKKKNDDVKMDKDDVDDKKTDYDSNIFNNNTRSTYIPIPLRGLLLDNNDGDGDHDDDDIDDDDHDDPARRRGDDDGQNLSYNDSNTTFTTTIRGSNIRYIQFPDNTNLTSLVSTGIERERLALQKYQKTIRKNR